MFSNYIKILHLSLLISTFVFSQANSEMADLNVNFTSPKIYDQKYLPIEDGLEYIYDTSIGEAELNVTKCEESYNFTISTRGIEFKQIFSKTRKGLILNETENSILFGSTVTKYITPITRIPMPLTEGQTWFERTSQIIDGDTTEVTMWGKLLGEEQITTEAGTFSCIKIQLKFSSNGKTDTITEWLAQDIGLVKTKAELKTNGFCGSLQSLLGLETVTFELKKVKS